MIHASVKSCRSALFAFRMNILNSIPVLLKGNLPMSFIPMESLLAIMDSVSRKLWYLAFYLCQCCFHFPRIIIFSNIILLTIICWLSYLHHQLCVLPANSRGAYYHEVRSCTLFNFSGN